MISLFGAARSVVSFLALLGVLAVPGFPALYLVAYPAVALRPERRRAAVAAYGRLMGRMIFAALRLGGARFTRSGSLPSEGPALIVMNHQSLLDILTIVLMAAPDVPVFITRKRYTRFIPLVSPGIRLLKCPIVDPGRDTEGTVEVLRRHAVSGAAAILIFPEGHRTRDGEIRPFKTAGLQAILGARPMPVHVVVTDGFWAGRRFVDFLFNIHRIRGRTEVLGVFDPPASEEEVPAFAERIHGLMVERLQRMRSC